MCQCIDGLLTDVMLQTHDDCVDVTDDLDDDLDSFVEAQIVIIDQNSWLQDDINKQIWTSALKVIIVQITRYGC